MTATNSNPKLHPVNFYEIRAGKIQLTGGKSIALKHILFKTKRFNLVFIPEGGRKRVVTTEFIEILEPDGFRYIPYGIPPETDMENIYGVAKSKGLIEDEGDHEAVRVCWNHEFEAHTALRTRKMRLVLFDPDRFPDEAERVLIAWSDKLMRNAGYVYYD